jgi:phosphoribosylformimino-5-aminoimidazole carboxamide ribotide isomerase
VRLYPAIDILGGSAVRLVRGDYDAKKVYDADPVAAARAWVDAGARHLHVVDLDGARDGRPASIDHLRAIVAASEVPVQYGGGLRTAAAVQQALEAGAARVILGTAAFTDRELLKRVLASHPSERILVGVDARGGLVATHGWRQSTSMPAGDALAALREAGVGGFVYTDIDHDGMLDGADSSTVASVLAAAGDVPVIVSGGIGSLEDLRALAALRAEHGLAQLDGVIVGTALYERRFTIAEAHEALAS